MLALAVPVAIYIAELLRKQMNKEIFRQKLFYS